MPLINYDMAMYAIKMSDEPPTRMLSNDLKMVKIMVLQPLFTMIVLFLLIILLQYGASKLSASNAASQMRVLLSIVGVYLGLTVLLFLVHTFYYTWFPWKTMTLDELKLLVFNHYVTLGIIGTLMCIICRTLLGTT
jgi:hypothetical protein